MRTLTSIRHARIRLGALALAVIALWPGAAPGQEALDALLARGHVAHWLVCGPFASDLPGGIVAAAADGAATLGDTDFMAPLGGVAGLRPRHLLAIARPEGEAVWQRAGTDGPVLDLGPFFPSQGEGVAYAAFYTQAAAPQDVVISVQSLLGARVWVNDLAMPVPPGGRPEARGIQRIPVRLAAGLNLVVVQVPGVAPAALAAALGMPEAALAGRVRATRPLLRGDQGFAFAVTVRPLSEVGGIYFETKLESVGTFSGTESAPMQDLRLALYRLGTEAGPEATVRVESDAITGPILARVPALAGGEHYFVDLALPVGGAMAGAELPVQVTVASGGAERSFNDSVAVLPRAAPGTVAVISGPFHEAQRDPGAVGAAARLRALADQTARHGEVPAYGFNLGHGAHWLAALAAQPGALPAWRDGVVAERIATLATYAPLDERLAHPELILRNYEYGLAAARAMLGELRPSAIAWDSTGVAPQTPQWLAHAGLGGITSNLGEAGMTALSAHTAPDGTALPHRHKRTAPGPGGAEALRQLASTQRQPMAARDIGLDLLPLVNAIPPPEPFMREAESLERAMPGVRMDGGGAHRFFERLPRGTLADLPALTAAPPRRAPGAVLAAGAAGEAHALATRRTLDAEQFATLAALLGAQYPADALDAAWRHLLHAGHPARLAADDDADTLATVRIAATWADGVLGKALDYIANEADTLGNAPTDTTGVRALVVFNPMAWTRDDVVTAEITLPGAAGLTVLDDRGDAVPFQADRIRQNARREITAARLRFVARAVPGIGYRTYYVAPRGRLSEPAFSGDPQLANDRFVATIDPATGDLAGVSARADGTASLAGALAQVVGLPQDGAQNAGGREVWTTGAPWRAGGNVDIRTSTLPGMQQATVSADFGGGRVVREYRIYDGLPRIDCVVRFENLPINADSVIGLLSEVDPAARSPVFGERYAASVGNFAHAPLSFQSGPDARNHALQPAWNWAALSPNDAIRVGPDRAVPLRPALVVTPTALLDAANRVVNALALRGVPATLRIEDDAREPGALIDDVPLPGANHFDGMVIQLLAAPSAANPVLQALPETARTYLGERIAQGVAVLAPAPRAADATPAPMLVLAGADTPTTRRMAEEFARDIARVGAFPLPPSALFTVSAPENAMEGFAVLFPGARLSGGEPKGGLFVALGTAGDAAAREHRFALLPFAGEWRGAQIGMAAEAHAAPFLAVETSLHSGRQPGAQRLLGVDSAGFVVTSLRPANEGRAARRDQAVHPNDGIRVRGYESTGQPWRGRVASFFAAREAAPCDLLGKRGIAALRDASGVAVEARGFGIGDWWIAPDTRFPHGANTSLAPAADAYGPDHPAVFSRDGGPAPWGHLPVAIALHGVDKPTLVIANLGGDTALSGSVTLAAPPGWSVGPEQVPFQLAAGRHLETALDWAATGAAVVDEDVAALVAEVTVGGQVHRAVWPDTPPRASLRMERTLAQIKVTVSNDGAVPIEGHLDLVVPPAFWPELGGLPRVTVLPARAAISVLPGRTQDVLFRISDPDAPLAARPRLVANGWPIAQGQ